MLSEMVFSNHLLPLGATVLQCVRYSMSKKVTIDLPESVFSILRTSPEEFSRELCLAAAVKWYEVGRISQSKAAELAVMSRQVFLLTLGRFELTPFQATARELENKVDRE